MKSTIENILTRVESFHKTQRSTAQLSNPHQNHLPSSTHRLNSSKSRRQNTKMCFLAETIFQECRHFGRREATTVCARAEAMGMKSGCSFSMVTSTRQVPGFCAACRYRKSVGQEGQSFTFRAEDGQVTKFSRKSTKGR